MSESWKVYEALVRRKDTELQRLYLNFGFTHPKKVSLKNAPKVIEDLLKHGLDEPAPGSLTEAIWQLNVKWAPVLDLWGKAYDRHPLNQEMYAKRLTTYTQEQLSDAEKLLTELEATVADPKWKSIQ